MPFAFIIMNHELTGEQANELFSRYKIDGIFSLPPALQPLWENVSPSGELDITKLSQIIDWLKRSGRSGDYVLIQGEFGATYYIVNACFKEGFIPIYATSKRIYKEEKQNDGSVKREHIFKHVNFRKYKEYY